MYASEGCAGSRASFERPFYIGGDPATIEISPLRPDAFPVNIAGIDTAGVERQMTFE